MRVLNRPPLQHDWHDRRAEGYDVVVIGSGYGGSVTAARIATASWPNAPPTICVLERGKEWLPGDFPDTLEGGAAESRSGLNPLGLYDLRLNPDIGVLSGSGLGGTSLVNANCAILPDFEVFDDGRWPQAIRDVRDAGDLQRYYDRAHQTLRAAPHPQGLEISKVQAMRNGAAGISDSQFHLHDITVNFEDGVNPWGVDQQPCINCGDCVTGCNVGAKNTLDTSYLAIAKAAGAHLFTQVEVDYIEKTDDGAYLLHFLRRDNSFSQEAGSLRAARMVIIAAGALGSTGVLLRSRERGLSIADPLGTRFSGNGDFFSLTYDSNVQTNCLGWGAHPDSDRARRQQPTPDVRLNPGPTIVSYVKFNLSAPLKQRMKTDDLSIPLLYVDAVRFSLALTAGREEDQVKAGRWDRDFTEATALESGAANFSLVYLGNGHDSADGKIKLEPITKQPVIDWPGVGSEPEFGAANQILRQHAEALGGKFLENPVWAISPAKTLITAHPLGGCPMGEDHVGGVVNHLGQVFDAAGNLHRGLYVADASTIPTSLGVNPFLTISALAERRAEALIRQLGGTVTQSNV